MGLKLKLIVPQAWNNVAHAPARYRDIAKVTRNEMDMKVVDRSASGYPVINTNVVTIGVETLPNGTLGFTQHEVNSDHLGTAQIRKKTLHAVSVSLQDALGTPENCPIEHIRRHFVQLFGGCHGYWGHKTGGD